MILVTGASGLLGSRLAVVARDRGRTVVGVHHRHPVEIPGVQCLGLDLADGDRLQALMDRLGPRWIVHCAALTDVDGCEDDPGQAWRVNVEATNELVRAAARVGAGLVYVSTDSVFDGETGDYSEEDPPRPLNAYAKSKLAGEEAVEKTLEEHLVIRTNFYGWSPQAKPSLAEWILDRLESGTGLTGFIDVTFSPILADDLSGIILDMMERGLRGLYHVAGAEACSKHEFALRIADVFDLDRELVKRGSIGGSSLRAPRPRDTSLRTCRASEVQGRPMPDLESGLRRFKALRDSGFREQARSYRGEVYGKA